MSTKFEGARNGQESCSSETPIRLSRLWVVAEHETAWHVGSKAWKISFHVKLHRSAGAFHVPSEKPTHWISPKSLRIESRFVWVHQPPLAAWHRTDIWKRPAHALKAGVSSRPNHLQALMPKDPSRRLQFRFHEQAEDHRLICSCWGYYYFVSRAEISATQLQKPSAIITPPALSWHNMSTRSAVTLQCIAFACWVQAVLLVFKKAYRSCLTAHVVPLVKRTSHVICHFSWEKRTAHFIYNPPSVKHTAHYLCLQWIVCLALSLSPGTSNCRL